MAIPYEDIRKAIESRDLKTLEAYKGAGTEYKDKGVELSIDYDYNIGGVTLAGEDGVIRPALSILAVKSGDPDIVRAVHAVGGVDFSHRNEFDNSPAYESISAGNSEMVRAVHEVGGNFGCADGCGYENWKTSHWAVMSGDFEVVRAVYEAGSDFTAVDKRGNTPEDFAAHEAKYRQTPEELVAHGDALGNGGWGAFDPRIVPLVEEIAAKQREEKARAEQSARPVDVYLGQEDEREAERAKIHASTEKSIAEHDPMPELGKEGGASKSSTESQESPDDPAR